VTTKATKGKRATDISSHNKLSAIALGLHLFQFDDDDVVAVVDVVQQYTKAIKRVSGLLISKFRPQCSFG